MRRQAQKQVDSVDDEAGVTRRAITQTGLSLGESGNRGWPQPPKKKGLTAWYSPAVSLGLSLPVFIFLGYDISPHDDDDTNKDRTSDTIPEPEGNRDWMGMNWMRQTNLSATLRI